MSDGVRAESVARAPAPPLRDLVRYHGYDLRGSAPGRHRGLPSPSLTFVVTFGPDLQLQGPDDQRARFRACLAGLHDVPETIVHDGRQSGVHVVVHPLAARALFGLPAGELAFASVEVADVVGTIGAELADRMAATEDAGWDARFAALDDVLGALLRRGRTPGPDELGHAWSALTAPGAAPVGEVAAEVGWSADHLGRRFRAEFGVGPAVARRLGRFDRARRDVARRAARAPGPDPMVELPCRRAPLDAPSPAARLDLADVAAAHGYADQAHLAREFRALAGVPATRWVAEEVDTGQAGHEPDVGFVQDPHPAGAASSSA